MKCLTQQTNNNTIMSVNRKEYMINMSCDIKKRIVLIVLAVTVSVAAACFISQQNVYAADKGTYLIKVNTKKNVVTAYKKSIINGKKKYVPIRAMVVSCGRATSRSSTTPAGSYRMSDKSKWGLLYGGVWGRYTVRFYRDYLFHTVAYRNRHDPKSLYVSEYYKLGRKASAGCVRMQFIDEQWLYNTCPKGTRVIVYKSSKTGPLGKPERVGFNKKAKLKRKYGTYYEPTDPVKNNKGYNLKAPAIKVSYPADIRVNTAGEEQKAVRKPAGTAADPLKFTIRYGSRFDPKKGVSAKDRRTFQDLTSKVKYRIFARTEKTDEQGNDVYGWEKVTSADTSKEGAVYRIEYKCYYKYCSKYTGKIFSEITIGGKTNDDSPDYDDEEELNEMIDDPGDDLGE